MQEIWAICKSGNGESGNGMRGMIGMQGIRVGMQGIRVGLQGIGVGMWGIRVGMQGIRVGMRGIGGENAERDKNKRK